MKNLFLSILLAAVCSNSFAQVPSYLPTSGLLAWYPLDTNLRNAYGGPMNNGEARGAVAYGTDRFGVPNHSYRGNGHSLCNIPMHNFPLGNNPRSVSLFFKLDTPVVGGGKSLFSWGGNILGYRFGLFAEDTMVGVEYVNGYVSTHFGGDTMWHNLTVTYPPGGSGSMSVKLYYDGRLIAMPYIHSLVGAFNTDTGVWHDIGGSIYFGSSYSDSWHGYIDDIGVWDRELTACEVEQIANSGPIHPPVTVTGLTLTTLTTYLSYQWLAGSTAISGATAFTYTAPAAGSYRVVVADSAGCSDTSLVAIVVSTSVSAANAEGNPVIVYPNPSKSVFYVNSPVDVNIVVTDASGQILKQKDRVKTVDFSGLPQGVYFLSVFDEDGVKIKTERVNWLGK